MKGLRCFSARNVLQLMALLAKRKAISDSDGSGSLLDITLHKSQSQSQSQLLYDWRFISNQFVLATSPLRPTTSIFLTEHLLLYSLYNTFSDDGMGLSFTIAAGPRQRSHSRVQFPRDLRHILLSQIWDSPNLEGQAPYLYTQEQGGPVIPPGTGFPFRILLRLAGLRWSIRTRFHAVYTTQIFTSLPLNVLKAEKASYAAPSISPCLF
jgi:hypothetical protein